MKICCDKGRVWKCYEDMRITVLIPPLLLITCSLIRESSCAGVLPGSVKACKIKKLKVRVTRILYSMYGDTSEPPVTKVKIHVWDPQSKTAKVLGYTGWNSNGRSLFPVWNETDGMVESDDNPGWQ